MQQDDNSNDDSRGPAESPQAAARRQRLAAELRTNLGKRKALARSRREPADADSRDERSPSRVADVAAHRVPAQAMSRDAGLDAVVDDGLVVAGAR